MKSPLLRRSYVGIGFVESQWKQIDRVIEFLRRDGDYKENRRTILEAFAAYSILTLSKSADWLALWRDVFVPARESYHENIIDRIRAGREPKYFDPR